MKKSNRKTINDTTNSSPINKPEVNVGPSTFSVDVETQNSKIILNGCTINFNFATTPSINQNILTEMESMIDKLNIEDCFTSSNEVNNYGDGFEDMYDDAPPSPCDCGDDCECDDDCTCDCDPVDGPEDPESQQRKRAVKASAAEVMKVAANTFAAEMNRSQDLEKVIPPLIEKVRASMLEELKSPKPSSNAKPDDGITSTIDTFKKAVDNIGKNNK